LGREREEELYGTCFILIFFLEMNFVCFSFSIHKGILSLYDGVRRSLRRLASIVLENGWSVPEIIDVELKIINVELNNKKPFLLLMVWLSSYLWFLFPYIWYLWFLKKTCLFNFISTPKWEKEMHTTIRT